MHFFDLFLVVFICLSVGFDLWQNRIPNWLNFSATAVGISIGACAGIHALLDSFLGLGLAVAILLVPFVVGGLGAGDVKFLAAVGAILGVQWVPRIFFYTALLGIPLALVAMLFQGVRANMFRGAWVDLKLLWLSRGAALPESVTDRVSRGARTVPYGVAIGLGTLIAFYADSYGKWAGF